MADSKMNPLPSDSAPTTLQRWLGVMPLFATFFVVGYMVSRSEIVEGIYNRMNVELPLPTRIAISLGEFMRSYYMLWLPTMFLLVWIYFTYGCKNRNRLVIINLLTFIVFGVCLLLFVDGYVLPFIKLHETLRRK